MSRRFVVGRVGDIPEGTSVIVELGGRSIGVFNRGGTFYALLNRCPHKGAQLCRGTVVGSLESSAPGTYDYDAARGFLQCPWHGWEFDLATGRSYHDPHRTRVRSYFVEVEDGTAVTSQLAAGGAVPGTITEQRSGRRRGPFTAETFPVSIEQDYVVVQLRAS